MKTQLLIPAAGMGTRLGAPSPKALLDLCGTPMLVRTLRRFESLGIARDAVITVPPTHRTLFEETLGAAFPDAQFTLVDGGRERQDSVDNGLKALDPATELVAVHDAARPFISPESADAAIAAAAQYGAATVAIRCVDTVLQGDEDDFLVHTPDRSLLWACQTPQVFRVDVLRRAHAEARAAGFLGTDDATLVQRLGGKVKLAPGTPLNFKVTTPGDLALARCVIEGGLA